MTTTDSVRTAYTSQTSRDFYGITRGIATPEQRRGWEADFDRWIAAHEAEVVGRILDRIDALHAGIDALNVRVRPHGRVVQVCVACGTDDGNWQQHPCPTRRLTADIRGELRLSQGAAAIRGERP
jgi:hypothetical protein